MTTRQQQQQQQIPMKGARITALVTLGTLLCCLCCCVVPGAIILGALNSVSEEWPVVEATLISKIDCHSDFDSDSNSDSYFYSDSNSDSDSSSDSSSDSDSDSDSDDQEEDPTYYLTYNYVTLDGENITSTTVYCISLTATTISDSDSTSSIRYNPDDPTEILDTLLVSYGLVASRIMTGIGWTLVLVTLGLTVWGCRDWGQQEPPNNINFNTNINNNNNNYNNNNNDIEIPSIVNDIEIPSIVNDPNKPIYATAVAGSNSNNNNDSVIPSIVNDPNKPIYATAVAVPIGDSYDAGIVRYK